MRGRSAPGPEARKCLLWHLLDIKLHLGRHWNGAMESPRRISVLVVAACWITNAIGASVTIASIPPHANTASNSPFPLQLQLRVPFGPTAFPSAGHSYLAYELYITNFTDGPITLRRIEVRDADNTAKDPVAAFEAEQIEALLQPVGAAAGNDPRQLAAGATTIAFMWIPFDAARSVPNRLLHRVLTSDSYSDGATIDTHSTQLHVLSPPLQGGDWLAADGPSNARDNHHRRGVLIFDGEAVDSRRYAIDWILLKQGERLSGDPSDKRSYYAYGKAVLAVASGTVVTARDGLPDNVPRHNNVFQTAVPITMDTVGGNTITLDLGGGQYAYYFHLQPGSLQVKVGDHVRRGEVIARVGCSGDARAPHLHFEVTTSPEVLRGEGVPYVIDYFRSKSSGGSWQPRAHELPLDGMNIEFVPRRQR